MQVRIASSLLIVIAALVAYPVYDYLFNWDSEMDLVDLEFLKALRAEEKFRAKKEFDCDLIIPGFTYSADTRSILILALKADSVEYDVWDGNHMDVRGYIGDWSGRTYKASKLLLCKNLKTQIPEPNKFGR